MKTHKIALFAVLFISLTQFNFAYADVAAFDEAAGPGLEFSDDVGAIEEFDPETQTAEDVFDLYYGEEIGFEFNYFSAEGPAQSQTAAQRIQEQFKVYSENPRILNLIAEARQNLRTKKYTERRYDARRKRYYFVTYCYRAVKDALLDAKLVNYYLPGAEAREAVGILARAGFKNLMDQPELADLFTRKPELVPKGMIMVYRNNPGYKPAASCRGCARPSNAGHIEIKSADSGQQGYLSVSESRKPTYGYLVPQHRQLIGVMYKDGLGL